MTDIEKVALPAAAIENLTHHQQQADMDGTFVKVSRQALDEVLSFIAAMQPAPREPVAWMYEYGGGTVACTTTRYEPAVLSALGYTETPLYAFPTPPTGGSDAE